MYDASLDLRTALVFGHQLRLECGQPVTRNIQLQLPAWSNDRLRTYAVAVIARGQHALGQLFLELACEPGFSQNGSGILVLDLGQQLVNQFIRK